MKLSKNQKLLIKAIAEKIPNQKRVINSNTFISGEDLLLSGHTEVEGKEIDPEKDYIMNLPMYFECVHEKRIAKQAKKKGFEGVFNYVSRFLDNQDTSQLRNDLKVIWNK